MTRTETGTTTYTAHFEWEVGKDPQQVWPCWCGRTHRGDYGLYDFCHHHCEHSEPLMKLDTNYYICIECGLTFQLEATDEAHDHE